MQESKTLKGELPVLPIFVLCLCRLAEPLILTSTPLYLTQPELLSTIGVDEANISSWNGVFAAIFSVMTSLAAPIWGLVSDCSGRRPTIAAGLSVFMVSVLGLGFATHLATLIGCFTSLGFACGSLSLLRASLSELVPNEEHRAQVFGLLPLMWLVGALIGPVITSALMSDAVQHWGIIQGQNILHSTPWLLPNLAISTLALICVLGVLAFLPETLSEDDRQGVAKAISSKWRNFIQGVRGRGNLAGPRSEMSAEKAWEVEGLVSGAINTDSDDADSLPTGNGDDTVFTKEVIKSLVAFSALSSHSVIFDELLPLLMLLKLETAPEAHNPAPWLFFSGGMGLDRGTIAQYLVFYGVSAILLQMFVYSTVVRVWGPLQTFRRFSICFPPAYFVIPFLVHWVSLGHSLVMPLGALLLLKGAGSTMSFPCAMLVLNNAANPRYLGTIQGCASALAHFARAVGYLLLGFLMTVGMRINLDLIPWWTLGAFSVWACIFNYSLGR